MAKKESDNQTKFNPYLDELKKLVVDLNREKWASDWSVEAGFFGEPKIRGASIRMYKKSWPELIHFESWIGNADIERGSVSTAFHIETPLDSFGVRRTDVNRQLIENGAAKMKEWDGYTLSPKSFQPIKCQTPFEDLNIAAVLKPVYNKLRHLGGLIDQALKLS
jgi:hypothetical protein